jgi:hypothetical protein
VRESFSRMMSGIGTERFSEVMEEMRMAGNPNA